jgi:hypothetical protein
VDREADVRQILLRVRQGNRREDRLKG